MKSKIFLFSIVLLVTIVEAQAQPDCREKFSPYDFCRSDYATTDFVFYGEILQSEKHDSGIILVQVKKILKGKPANKVQVFLDIDIICTGVPPIGSRQIFNVIKTIVNGETRYYSKYISRPLTEYSNTALSNVFSYIDSVIKDKKENILEGVVAESLVHVRIATEKHEIADRFVFPPNSYKPLSNVFIEATNNKTNKIYRTKSNADGTFRFENIPLGDYQLVVVLSDGRKVERDISTDGSPCKRRRYLIFQEK